MPPPSVLCLTLAGVPWDAGVSFSEVAAGGWPCPRGPGAAVDRARWEGWGVARMGGVLLVGAAAATSDFHRGSV